MTSRSYGHYCAIATALDTVGDRWTLLLIRELMAGPRRYTDLAEGLPGISTDLLATRLRDLEDKGLVEREVLPPPAASKVYALTDDGAALEPILVALARWGARRLPGETTGEFRPNWLTFTLRSMFTPANAPGAIMTVDFLVDDFRLRAQIDHGTLSFDDQPTGPADIVISGDPAGLAQMAVDADSERAVLAEGRVTIDGDPRLISELRRVFGVRILAARSQRGGSEQGSGAVA